jgi:hypothetical protein
MERGVVVVVAVGSFEGRSLREGERRRHMMGLGEVAVAVQVD